MGPYPVSAVAQKVNSKALALEWSLSRHLELMACLGLVYRHLGSGRAWFRVEWLWHEVWNGWSKGEVLHRQCAMDVGQFVMSSGLVDWTE